MKSNYRKLGEFIRQVDMRNIEDKKENLLGVSVQKVFIPSIANTVGTDFTKYKVVKKGQFTYIPDTSRRGDKIGIALLEEYEEGLVSNVYTVFEIIDENEKTGNITEILPRKNELIRPAVANIDQALVVFAVTRPSPHFSLLDRFLVMMESKHIPVILCFNKEDSADDF